MSNADPAPIFAALGDTTRLALVRTLSAGGARSIAALSAGTGLTRQAVTKHLRVLEGVGLVESVRHGRETRFAFRPEPVNDLRGWIEEVAIQWVDALDRLKAHLGE